MSSQPLPPIKPSTDHQYHEALGIFALIRPLSASAQEAYHDTIEHCRSANVSQHYRQFQQLFHENKIEKEASIFSADEETYGGGSKEQWEGGFVLSLRCQPRNNQVGWVLGTQRGISDSKGVDLLVAPPTEKWTSRGIAGRHGEISLHPDSNRVMIKARHHMILSVEGMCHLGKNEQHSLERHDIFHIEDLSYVFELTPYYQSKDFVAELSGYMQKIQGPRWALTKPLTPASVGTPQAICNGRYLSSSTTLGVGSYGTVRAGWERKSGKGVAIKKFEDPKAVDIDEHKLVMLTFGEHVSCSKSRRLN